jgi:predicted TIM-barrel fold metal-dependent hydrolase
MRRRDVLRFASLSAAAAVLDPFAPGQPQPIPILDAHIHLFDPTRPGGVPWPPKDDAVLYKPSTPERYVALSTQFDVVGAIAIEASPLASDNDWLLHVAEKHPVIVGVIGDLVPSSPSYRRDLDRLRQNPLFLGFRYGNLWDRDLSVDLHKPGFIEGLKELAAAALVLECANPDPSLIRAILDVAERVPGLTIVIDHLPHVSVPAEAAARDAYWANLRHLARNPHVFVKLSEIPSLLNGALVTDPEFYRGALDAIWDVFGEDHILFGSDWPNSDHVAPYAQTLALVRSYIAQKSSAAQQKYFWKNSIAAYHWKRRQANQPML